MTASKDTLSREELKTEAQKIADRRLEAAEGDNKAFESKSDGYSRAISAAAYHQAAAADPEFAAAVPEGSYDSSSSTPDGDSAFDKAFEANRQALMALMADSANHILSAALQGALDAIDETRLTVDAIGGLAMQIEAAYLAGLLRPVVLADVEDMRDDLAEQKAETQAISEDLKAAKARRDAARIKRGEDANGMLLDNARTVPGRAIVRTSKPTSTSAETGDAFVGPGPTPGAGTVTEKTRDLTAAMREAALDPLRIGYLAMCSAAKSFQLMGDQQDSLDRSVKRIKDIYAFIKEITADDFSKLLQNDLQERAQGIVDGIVGTIQSKLDAVDQFVSLAARLPSPFVSTVKAMGDLPETSPVVDSLAALCGVKIEKFCEMQHMLEVAQQLDVSLGISIPKSPAIGRVRLLLDVPESDQISEPDDVPGQEANLILAVNLQDGATEVRCKFQRDNAPMTSVTVLTPTFGVEFREKPDAFGTGGGELVFQGLTHDTDVAQPYRSVSYDPVTHIYNFILGNVGGDPWASVIARKRQFTGSADEANLISLLPAYSWTDAISQPVGQSYLLARFPGNTVIDYGSGAAEFAVGIGEQEVFNLEYRATGNPSEIEVISDPVFAAWMANVSLRVMLFDPGTSTYASRTVATVVSGTKITIAGGAIPTPHLPGNRGAMRLVVDSHEIVQVTSIAPEEGTPAAFGIHRMDLELPTTRPHGTLLAGSKPTVGVTPTLRDGFLDPDIAGPADPEVRESADRVLPSGSTVVRATLENPSQAFMVPDIVSSGPGELYIEGLGPLAWTSATSENSNTTIRFVMSPSTTQPFLAGAVVEVLTTDVYLDFNVKFPDDWFDPIDDAMANILAGINKLTAQFCRILSGSAQNPGATAAAVIVATTGISLTLTAARSFIAMWKVALPTKLGDTIKAFQAMGADNAAIALSSGDARSVATMRSTDGSSFGAVMAISVEYMSRVTRQFDYDKISKAMSEVKAVLDSEATVIKRNSDVNIARDKAIKERWQASVNMSALAKDLPP